MATGGKALVLCADDYAQHAGVTQAVLALAAQGRLSATSALVLSPRWRADAAPLREWRTLLDVGLHLDFTSDFAIAAGHGLPLAAAMRRALLRGFDASAARIAIERQLDLFESAWQAPPDHVDGHQHVQQFAGIRQPLVRLLERRYGAHKPWLRVSRAAAGQRTLKSRVIAGLGAGTLEVMAARAHLPCAPALSGIYDFRGGQAAYARHMARWLAESPPGTLLMTHPGGPPAAGDAPDPIAAARIWEWAHLASPAFGAQCAAAGVELLRGSALYRRRSA